MSLIPAKYYYDDATQDQWQQTKKLKKDVSKDRAAKLDPDAPASADGYSNGGASAKDVMDNRSKTAKKVAIPGKPEPKPAAVIEAKPEVDLVASQMVFDDEGNEVGAEQAPSTTNFKKGKAGKAGKPALSAEEQEERMQRRAELKAKLASKIDVLREKRKAPGTKHGGPVKMREQILAERKRKQELRRQEKLKRKREQDDDEDAGEAEAKSEPEEEDEEDEEREGTFLFGNIQFKDGTRMTSDLSKVRNGVDHKKKKGPANNDIKAHLLKLEAKRRKLDQLTPEERKKQEEKDQWSSLMNQAEGVKVKDDEKLLKKALKRKEKQKLKSEIEWKERKQVVKDTIAARQKRREANLKARRDNKGKKGKNQPRLKKFSGVVKKSAGGKDAKKRAGFEGNAKSKGKLKK